MVTNRTTRSRLLEAAARLFAERGYRSVTLSDIGAAVGISGPAVYRHFKSKEGLLGELLVGVSEDLAAGARRRAEESPDPGDLIEALVEFHAAFAVDNPALIAIQARELPALAPEDQRRVRRAQRAYVDLWADAIAAAGGAGDGERGRALAAAHGLFGLLNSTPYSTRLASGAMRGLLASMALSALSALSAPRHGGLEPAAASCA